MFRIVLLAAIILNDAGEMANLLQQMGNLGILQPSNVAGNPNSKFQKVDEDVICDDKSQLKSIVKVPFQNCKEECSRNQDCTYIVYWLKSKKCLQYETCYQKVQPSQRDEKVSIWKKVTPCEERMAEYMGQMCAPFSLGILRPIFFPFEWEKGTNPDSAYRNPNFHCFCMASRWMTCAIFLTVGTNEATTVLSHLIEDDEEILLPFVRMEGPMSKIGGEKTMLMYHGKETELALDQVYAHIHLLPFNSKQKYHVNPCFHLQQCLSSGETCPITGQPFISGDAVWIFAEDSRLIRDRRSVPCISLYGMRSYIAQFGSAAGFHDPLRRKRVEGVQSPRVLMSLDVDYKIFFIFDDIAMQTGICTPAQMEGSSSQAPPLMASLKLGSESGETSSPSLDLSVPGVSALEGSDKSEGKKPRRRGGQKHKKQAAGSSSAEIPEIDLTKLDPEEIDLTKLDEDNFEKSVAAEIRSVHTLLIILCFMIIAFMIIHFWFSYNFRQHDVYIEFH